MTLTVTGLLQFGRFSCPIREVAVLKPIRKVTSSIGSPSAGSSIRTDNTLSSVLPGLSLIVKRSFFLHPTKLKRTTGLSETHCVGYEQDQSSMDCSSVLVLRISVATEKVS